MARKKLSGSVGGKPGVGKKVKRGYWQAGGGRTSDINRRGPKRGGPKKPRRPR